MMFSPALVGLLKFSLVSPFPFYYLFFFLLLMLAPLTPIGLEVVILYLISCYG